MNQSNDFARSLAAICKSGNLSLVEFSRMLDVPKTTLKNIMDNGNATLSTALRIADHLNVPLSLLTGEVISVEDIESLAVLIHYFAWIKPVAKDRGVVIENTCSIMEILQRKPCITPPAQDEQAT